MRPIAGERQWPEHGTLVSILLKEVHLVARAASCNHLFEILKTPGKHCVTSEKTLEP
jgi:hypothetical protein